MSDQVQSSYKIRNFGEFLEKCLKRKVIEYSLKPLTKPGDNYGSIMQAVDVKVAGVTDLDKVLCFDSSSNNFWISLVRDFLMLF